MKVSITLEGDRFDDLDDIETFLEGTKWKSVVCDIHDWLRQKTKYENREELQCVREELRRFIESEGLRLD